MANTAASPSQTKFAWTLDEALNWLEFDPHDPCLQFIALQLALRSDQKKISEKLLQSKGLRAITSPPRPTDLLSIFSGAAAVHESLQLEAMQPEREAIQVERPGAGRAVAARGGQKIDMPFPKVAVASLTGPTIQSHPWKEMLGDANPELSNLSKIVPQDFYLAESHSAEALLQSLTAASSWQQYIMQQSMSISADIRAMEFLKKQLLLDGEQYEKLMQLRIQEIALSGSDLYVTEGGDITLLILGEASELSEFLSDVRSVAATRPDVTQSTFSMNQIECLHATNSDRSLSVFAANPAPGLHVRSNSRVAFEEILNAATGRSGVDCLGSSTEFKYMRTLMPWGSAKAKEGAAKEDVFIYFSDPFIRRLVGPEVRLTQLRRLRCYNHLKMLNYASLLYKSELGESPSSIEDLIEHQCLPERFSPDTFKCADGGHYSLARDKDELDYAVCSRHGNDRFLTPCIEIPVLEVSKEEADRYEQFLQRYNQYWRAYFDPIGISISLENNCYNAKTIILPLIDNSVYTSLARTFSGLPRLLNQQHLLSDRTILSVACTLNRDAICGAIKDDRHRSTQKLSDHLQRFILQGIDNQIALHVLDDVPTFSIDMLSFLGQGLASSSMSATLGQALIANPTILMGVALFSSLNLPIYASIDVLNKEIVDSFFESIEEHLSNEANSQRNFFMGNDFYRCDLGKEKRIYCKAFIFGPVKLRVFWTHINNSIYAASQLNVIEDLYRLQEGSAGSTRSDDSHKARPANAILRLLPSNWNKFLPDATMSWKENNRCACRRNLAPLTIFSRSLAAERQKRESDSSVLSGDIHGAIDSHQFLGVSRSCPDKGIYRFDSERAEVVCSLHGCRRRPAQSIDICSGAAGSQIDAHSNIPPQEIESATACLTFLPEGLQAELFLQRKQD